MPRRPLRDLTGLSARLSPRDKAILTDLAAHGFLTVTQIHVLHFGDLTPTSGLRSAQRVLARLQRERVAGRLTRRIGGHRAGSGGVVYYADELGQRLLRAEGNQRTRRRFHEPSTRFLAHQLGIGDARVALVHADRTGQLELLRCDIEPACWRSYVGIGGTRVTLKPDLYAETASPPYGEFVDATFIEIDRGTESIPTLIKKCREYEAYRRQGIEQEQADGSFPRVLWSLGAETEDKAIRRRAALAAAIAADRTLPDGLFQITDPIQLIHAIEEGGQL
ncbi:replication-relaxation family protein [Nocardia salmonicida]|uniref:replication-relaxation family protein n=1 Tax=Nocardia salmonicida TaxID=53431 RepID=UPI00369F9292